MMRHRYVVGDYALYWQTKLYESGFKWLLSGRIYEPVAQVLLLIFYEISRESQLSKLLK